MCTAGAMPRTTEQARAVGVACPACTEANDIILATRGLSRVALHAKKLPKWGGSDAAGPTPEN